MEGPVLEEVPDYEETMIWDPARKRRDSDDEEFNAFDAEVGNFGHPDFWEPVGESFGGQRTTSEAEQYSEKGLHSLSLSSLLLSHFSRKNH